MINDITEGIGKAFVFDKIRPGLRSYFLKAGISEVPYSLFGMFFWLSVLPVAYIFIFYGWNEILSLEQNLLIEFVLALGLWLLLHTVVIVAILIMMYIFMDLKIYNRTSKMEEVLPDFLRMVSENLKGGMPFEKSLWSSIRPDFGILADEVRLAAKKVITGQDVDESLLTFTDKYDSPMLRRAFNLIIEGLKGGGKVAEIIDQVIENIEETRELKSELAATNLSYVIFVAVIVILVSPGLFTLSFQFLTVLEGISEKIGGAGNSEGSGSIPISFGQLSVKPDVFRGFSVNALLVISFFSSMMISIIQKGSIKAGVKYIPMLMISSQVMYYLMMSMASGLFSSLIS